MLTHALVQYVFDDEEHSVTIRPHGNSKKRESYLRTMPSTLSNLKKVTKNLTPKFAVCKVHTESGGLTKATSVGSLPRNRQQAANLGRRTETYDPMCIGKLKDSLFVMMTMCKEGEGMKTDNHIVRIVTGAPEPMALLCFDWSLNDLERFCTGESHTVLCVDQFG